MIPAHDLVCTDSFCCNYGNPADPELCEPDHFREPNGPWRDGRMHVLAGKCPTCIFRPGNRMGLAETTVDNMVASCVQRQASIPCHVTLDGPRSICRGFWDVHRDKIVPLVLAEAMGLIEFDELPEE